MTEERAVYKVGSVNALNLFDDAFKLTIRTTKSEAYKAGAMAGIRKIIDGCSIESPYSEGEAEDDAFFAGVQEGLEISGQYLLTHPEAALRAAK